MGITFCGGVSGQTHTQSYLGLNTDRAGQTFDNYIPKDESPGYARFVDVCRSDCIV